MIKPCCEIFFARSQRSVAQNCENCWIKWTQTLKRRNLQTFSFSPCAHTFVSHVCTLIYRFQFLFLFFASISLLLFVVFSGSEQLALRPETWKSRQNHVPPNQSWNSQRRRNSSAIGCLRLQVIDLLFLFHFFYKGWKRRIVCKKIHWLLILQSGFWLNSYVVRESVRETRLIFCFLFNAFENGFFGENVFCFRGMFDNSLKLSKLFHLILEESVD